MVAVNKHTNGCEIRCKQFYTVGMKNDYDTKGRMVMRKTSVIVTKGKDPTQRLWDKNSL
jgi:hypothetical protein